MLGAPSLPYPFITLGQGGRVGVLNSANGSVLIDAESRVGH